MNIYQSNAYRKDLSCIYKKLTLITFLTLSIKFLYRKGVIGKIKYQTERFKKKHTNFNRMVYLQIRSLSCTAQEI